MITLYNIFQDFIKQTKIYIQNVLPKRVSELTNDAGYLTSHQDISGKQDKLTFDTIPTANSYNPVTSDGVKKAIDAKTVDLSNYYTKTQVDAAITQADWNVADTTSKAFIKNKPNNLSNIGAHQNFKLNILNKRDNKGWPTYFLMHELKQYNPDTLTNHISESYGFNGMVFGAPRIGNSANQSLAIVKVGLGYEYNDLYSSSTHYSPVVLKDETNNKYYWAMKVNGSSQGIYMLGVFTNNPLNTEILAIDMKGTLPSGWSLVHTAKPYILDNTSVSKANVADTATCLKTFAYRPSDANIQKGDGLVRYFIATSSMASNKPMHDAAILHLAWDNNGGFDSQFAITNVDANIQTRSQNNGKWGNWKTFLDEKNYTDYAPTKTGVGASGTWGINISGNANTAQKLSTARTISLTGDVTGSATFDGSSNISINASRPYVIGETRKYTVDLSTLDTTKFYPIIFDSNDIILRCEIHSPNMLGNYPYNQNTISFRLLCNGWGDTKYSFSIDEYFVYDSKEITIGCIGRGAQCGHNCVWVRGGMEYLIVSNRKPILHTEDVTFTINGTETYTVGTNYYGGTGNNNVNIIFTPQQTITSGSWHEGTAHGLFEKAINDGNGNNIADTYLKKSGGTMTGPLNFANAAWNAVGDDSYIGDHNLGGTLCVKGANNSETGIALFNPGNEKDYVRISYSGGNINFSKKIGGNLAGNADTATTADVAKVISGFAGIDNGTWGHHTGTYIAGFHEEGGGSIQWRAEGGKLYERVNGTFWQREGAYEVIDTSTINNYAPTKTGGGASGTWNINITGTATKATQDASGNVIIDTYAKKTYVDGAISGAVRKITTYTGATSTANGTGGLVPMPTKGQQEKFLKADGTWGDVSKPFNAKGHLVLPNGAELWVD